MAGTAVEKSTFDVQRYSDSQFADWPTDAKWDNVECHRFKPDSTITDGSCTYTLKRLLGRQSYLAHMAALEVKLAMRREDGTAIPASQLVAPVNNVLHSLFSSVRVQIEDVLINPSPENYMYKAYFQHVLGFGMEAQYNHMQASGWYKDSATRFEDTGDRNAGFSQRNKLFRIDRTAGGEYIDGSVTFTGRLITDLQMCTGGIPPGLQMTIDLRYTPHAFRLQSAVPTGNPKPKDEKYRLDITAMTLLMPIGTLNSEVFAMNQRSLKLGKEIKLHYKRASVKVIHVPSGNMDGGADHLFLHALNPSRVVVGLLPTAVFRGDYHKNPYRFARMWGNGEKMAFVEEIQLMLNGKSLDNMTSRSTRSDANSSFYRMCNFMGLLNTPKGNFIGYTEFMSDSYFEVFDLSTSGFSGADYLVPAIKLGGTALNVTFSNSVPEDLTIIVYAEYPSLLTVDKNGLVKMTYLDV